jgi:hypothetical protein
MGSRNASAMMEEMTERAFEIMLNNFYRPLPPVVDMIMPAYDIKPRKPRHCEREVVERPKIGRNEPCPCGSCELPELGFMGHHSHQRGQFAMIF